MFAPVSGKVVAVNTDLRACGRIRSDYATIRKASRII
jgi:hypothetical protein